MRLMIQTSPGEYLFALLMAVSPIIGSVWVDPATTKWIVFGVGCAMVVGVLAAALKPVKRIPGPSGAPGAGGSAPSAH